MIGALGAARGAITNVERDQPFHVGGVDEGAGAVGVVGIVLAVKLHRAFKMGQGASIFPGTADKSAAR